jgi:hypothetical protein
MGAMDSDTFGPGFGVTLRLFARNGIGLPLCGRTGATVTRGQEDTGRQAEWVTRGTIVLGPRVVFTLLPGAGQA